MKVVILCGGLGTRLREETEYRPKPMVPIGGRPILWHIMKSYAHHGFKDFILCLGYKGEMIKDYFRNYQWNTSAVTMCLGARPHIAYHSQHDEEDWTVTMVDTGATTQTGGRLKRVMKFIDGDDFLLTYGDGLINSDLRAAVRFHREHGAVATVTAVHPPERFGMLTLEGCNVTRFREKVTAPSSFISAGFFVFQRTVERYLEADDCVLERTPLESLAEAGQLKAFIHEGFWQCMDTSREMEALNRLWNEGTAPWKVW
jgi:glucose-1-phosphate cytidylyltransferase